MIALRAPPLAPRAAYGFAAVQSRPKATRPLAALLDLLAELLDATPVDALPEFPPDPPAAQDADAAPPAAAAASDEPAPPEPGDFYGADLGEDTCADLAPGAQAPRGCSTRAPIKASGSDAAGSIR